jgi:hypothetical protein
MTATCDSIVVGRVVSEVRSIAPSWDDILGEIIPVKIA